MKNKSLLSILTAALFATSSYAQDVISLKSGNKLSAKILEINTSEIKYKRFDNPNGPTYVVSKSDIQKIVYENGTVDLLGSPAVTEAPNDSIVKTTPAPKVKSYVTKKKKKAIIGFNLVLPTSTWPATALSNMGTTSFLKGQGHDVTSYGLGLTIDFPVSKNFNIFFDGNTYNYNILLGKQGTDAHSTWADEQMVTHWDEPDAPHINYVHNLPTDVYFDMQATGFRIGGKYLLFNGKKIRPWVGAGFGFYAWEANYCNKKKDKTYGNDKGYATGISMLAGVNFELFDGLTLTPFIDLGSPVATYKIEGLFYDQWDIEYNAHIMGTNRIGLSIFF